MTTHIRTSNRGRGKRLNKEERVRLQDKFLKAFSMTANVRAACMSAGIDRSTFYAWQEHDETFALRYHQAEAEASDVVRAEIWRRGIQGVEKPLVSMGKLVYDEQGKPMTVREYSDALLTLLAKARMPEFREKQQVDAHITHNGAIDAKNTLAVDLGSLTREQLHAMKTLLEQEDR